MSTKTALPYVVCAIVGATLLACGGDSPGITDPVVKDTTTKAGPTKTARINALLTEITTGQTAASASLSVGGVPTSAAPISSGGATTAGASSTADDAAACVLDAATKRFNCPSHTQPNGLVVAMYFQLLDKDGNAQTDFDTLTTKGIRRVTDQTGAVSSPLMTQTGPIPAVDTTNNHNDLVLSGVGTAAHALNGTGLMQVVIVPEGQPVVHISAPTVTSNLAFPTDTATHYPISGTITATVTSIRTGSPASTTSQVTTYDGTKIAKVVITLLNGTKRTCTYDMTAPATAPNCTG